MADKANHKDDLPLMANSDEILVRHYVLDWSFDMERREVEGSVIVILDPVEKEKHTAVDLKDSSETCRLTLPKANKKVCESSNSNCNSTAESSVEIKVANYNLTPESREIAASCEQVSSWVNRSIVAVPLPPPSEDLGQDSPTHFLVTDSLDTSHVVPSNQQVKSAGQHRDLVCNKLGTCSCGLNQPPQNGNFNLLLDCCDLCVDSVEEVIIPSTQYVVMFSNEEQDSDMLYEEYLKCKDFTCKPLEYLVEKWCLRIWKDNVTDPSDFPRVVRVKYKTSSSGASLWWIKDQDGKPCVFTPAAWINNRSLFPCQEPPMALASWQAHVTVPHGLVVLMSGDKEPVVTCFDQGKATYYYHTKMPHPAAVLAIAVGHWKRRTLVAGCALSECSRSLTEICHHQPRCKISYTDQQVLPCHLYAPDSLLDEAYSEFEDYFKESFQAAYDTLGPHPFPRLDVLIIPRSFVSLGLANPNLMFLSQSLVSGDGSSCIRISHELSHSWFGILIGARDWTEEWLSEGFATYMEDIIHAKVMKWDTTQARYHAELRAMIRYKVLCAELENTEEELQSLRPSQGKETRDQETSVLYVKNGMNPNKRFTQVHYLKGYFLLRHLAGLVGDEALNRFIRRYATEFHGKSVLSRELFSLMFEVFPDLSEKGITMSSIYHDWLDNPGMPKDLKEFKPRPDNHLYKQVLNVVNKWCTYNSMSIKYRKSQKKLKEIDICDIGDIKLVPEQVVLLLEDLLEEASLSKVTLEQLRDVYNISRCNADIQHRWCELVVKHSYSPGYGDIKAFLRNHQAMGIYLYGELVLSGKKAQRQIAEEAFHELADEMEKDTYVSVKEMVFGGN
ncbi:aminopeptidase O-like [Lineus longissimus]|uniref:aminopeptidase O-like n=1 Tax=Lineus longissimus TaxID=88925 RepID=UPI00315C63DB